MSLDIALLSYAYAPGVGGIETVSQLLVKGLRARGHRVRVLTHVEAAPGALPEPEVLRRPSAAALFAALSDCDAVLQSNVSVGLAWPLVLKLVRRPWVVVNHTPISRSNGTRHWRDQLKLWSLRGAQVYAVSDYLRSVTLPGQGLLSNPYAADHFHLPSQTNERSEDLLFVGRLVRAKGLDVLVDALGRLAEQGLRPILSIAGEGPEAEPVRARIARFGLQAQVRWLGTLRDRALGDAMRTHRVVAVPSRPEPPEALGLVAVEAIACGCAVVASRQGGLSEAVGPCGLLVPPEDPVALAGALRTLLIEPAVREHLLKDRAAHLSVFHPDKVLDHYEAALRSAMYQ